MYIFNAHFSITVDEVKLLQGVKTKYTTGEITGGGGGGGGVGGGGGGGGGE